MNLMSDQEIVQGILDRDVELTKQTDSRHHCLGFV